MKKLIEWLKSFFGVKTEEVKPTPKKRVVKKAAKADGKVTCDFGKLTKAQLLKEAKHRGVKVKSGALKAEILEQLNQLK